jgi:hypothetical protein
MSYYASFDLPELYNAAQFTLISACTLILVAVIALIWSLLRSRKVWWFSGLCVLLLGIGCWSIFVAFTGFQQIVFFGIQLQHPHSLSLAALHHILGTAYGADVLRCQIQVGVIAAAFVLFVVVVCRQLLRRPMSKDIRVIGEQVNG